MYIDFLFEIWFQCVIRAFRSICFPAGMIACFFSAHLTFSHHNQKQRQLQQRQRTLSPFFFVLKVRQCMIVAGDGPRVENIFFFFKINASIRWWLKDDGMLGKLRGIHSQDSCKDSVDMFFGFLVATKSTRDNVDHLLGNLPLLGTAVTSAYCMYSCYLL